MTREDELIARIKRGDDIARIREWFLNELIADKAEWSDLTPFEEMFTNSIAFAFEIWRRDQEERAARLNPN